jgi:hypothetical protein
LVSERVWTSLPWKVAEAWLLMAARSSSILMLVERCWPLPVFLEDSEFWRFAVMCAAYITQLPSAAGAYSIIEESLTRLHHIIVYWLRLDVFLVASRVWEANAIYY